MNVQTRIQNFIILKSYTGFFFITANKELDSQISTISATIAPMKHYVSN